MNKKLIVALLIVVLAGIVVTHLYLMDRGRRTTEPQYTGLARSVSGNDLVSERDPAVTLRFDPVYRHLGGQKFVLYGVADTEQHFFVETTDDDRLRSLYWIQFEAYLPGKPYTYDYEDSPLRMTLGDYEFYVDTASVYFDPDRKRKRGTDGALARQLIGRDGYTMPENFAYARLVYLTDDSRQKELMIIFIEDLAPLGVSANDLKEGGSEAQRWPEIERRHLDRIRSTLTLRPR